MTIDYSDKKPFVRIKLDKNGNRIPKREEDSHDGVWHVLFLYYTGDYEKHRNAKKHLAPKTVKEYKYRSGGKERSDRAVMKDMLKDHHEFGIKKGYFTADGSEGVVTKAYQRVLLSDHFEKFHHHLKTTKTKRKLEYRSEDTLNQYRDAFERYVSIFGDHPADEFPAGVTEDFQTKAATLKAKLRYGHKKSTGDLQPQTIRKEGIALNSFFRFISQRGLVNGPQITLELPSRKEKPEPRVWSASSRKKMEDYLKGKIKEYDQVKSRVHRKNAKGHAYLNHLRAFMLFDYCGLRLAEIWSMPLERIQASVFSGGLEIRDVNMKGGVNQRGRKFKVVFKPKNRKNQSVRLGNHVKEFLIEDLKRRNLEKERFYMDDGFGTNWFSSSDALGKAMYRMQKKLKIAGEAKRTHGTRATLLTDLCKENPYLAQQQARHADISTTIENYAAETPDEVEAALNRRNKGPEKVDSNNAERPESGRKVSGD